LLPLLGLDNILGTNISPSFLTSLTLSIEFPFPDLGLKSSYLELIGSLSIS
jgi:hypothetical protein